jgi:4-hydroxy-tetrahydrodipicolinate reductase
MATSVCVVGATGKFGRSIISQSTSNVKITGAVCSDSSPFVGKKLSSIGVQESNVMMVGASQIEDATSQSDVVLFVSKPEADMVNVPKVASRGKRIVVGTTGFNQLQLDGLLSILKGVPSIVAPNFSIGANILLKITRLVSGFDRLYDYSILEQHHKMKIDAPSGTARKMLEVLKSNRALTTAVTDRTVKPKRLAGEVEVSSFRGGGTPGIHQLVLAGDYEMIRVEHIAFSRAAASTGALLACEWLASRTEPRVYSMDDVLALTNAS